MSNEPIKPIEQNYVPYETLFPNAVIGGVEVDDNISSPTKTWSSEKINTELEDLSTDISSIDLSPYEEIDNKNIAGGYLGLDANAQFDPKSINNKTIYYVYESFQNKGSLITNTSSTALGSSLGTGFTTANHQVNAINGNTSVKIYRSGLSISSGVASSTGAILYSGDFCQLSAPAKVRLRTKVYFERNAPSTSQVIEVGYLNQTGASRTGVFFAQDPTVNSGNWRIGKSLAGSDTYENTNIAYTDSAITEFELYYDKATEICDFYINGTLVFSLTAVNCANATMLPIWKMITNSAVQTSLRRLVVCDLYWALEL